MPVMPGAEPYQADGGDLAVLLIHGFTGCPQALRGWAEHHAAEGLTVSLPRLPGHGTTWQELNRTRWEDWYAAVERTLLSLREQGKTVVVGGLSMGGGLAVRLAEVHPEHVGGLVLVNPAISSEDRRLALLPVLRHLIGSFPGIGSDVKADGVTELAYDRTPLHAAWSLTRMFATVQAELSRVRAPVLLIRSETDHVVPASSSAALLAGISSTDVIELVLTDSFHVATIDNDAALIRQQSLEFVQRIGAGVHP